MRDVFYGSLACTWLLACAGSGSPGDTATSPTSPADTDVDTDADTDADTDSDTDAVQTELAVTFAIDPDVAASIDEGPPVGPFYGQVFRAADVGPLGPDGDAVPLGDIQVDLDLPLDGSPTDVLFRISPVPAGEVTILGFVDTDGNTDLAAPEPDRGDPVTLPGQNTFALAADQENVVEVWFGLLNPL